jgi:Na+-translocating ferredoxin:NAD+ oxidoreductase RnfG subunit
MAKKKNPNDDEPKENIDNINNDADDTFGLPEVEYEPLKREEPVEEPAPKEEPVYETPYSSTEEVVSTEEPVPYEYPEELDDNDEHDQQYKSSYSYREDKQPVWPKVILIVLLILAAGGALFYFAYYQPKQKKIQAQALAEQQRQRDAADKKRRDQEAIDKRMREDAQRKADSIAAIPKVGTIEKLSGRTGQYYVVVASAIDDDLLMDFANKLVLQGKQVKLIPPFGKDGKFHRLAIESKETYADAQTTADGLKGGDYGDQLWVMKY